MLLRRKHSLIHLTNFFTMETLLVQTVHTLICALMMQEIMHISHVQCNTKESPSGNSLRENHLS